MLVLMLTIMTVSGLVRMRSHHHAVVAISHVAGRRVLHFVVVASLANGHTLFDQPWAHHAYLRYLFT